MVRATVAALLLAAAHAAAGQIPEAHGNLTRQNAQDSIPEAHGNLHRQQDTSAATPVTSDALAPRYVVRYTEREFQLQTATSAPQGLDVLEVRADTPGRKPLAVLTHGTSNSADDRAHLTPWAQLPQALWFAQRGYVAVVVIRDGYGRSGGTMDGHNNGCGQHGSFREAGEASARQLKEVIAAMATQPEVDATRVLSLGVSTGGFAQVALSADPPPGLRAAISFAGGRGGDGQGHNCNLDGVTSAFRAFGKRSRLPMLWLYAENDKWFPPPMAARFEQAFHEGGGQDQFVMVGPDGDDGHGYYRHVAAWAGQVEDFLRARNMLPLSAPLPLPPLPNVAAPTPLSASGRDAFKTFLAAGPYKAFAITGTGGWGYATGNFNQQLADQAAVDNCTKAAKFRVTCSVVNR